MEECAVTHPGALSPLRQREPRIAQLLLQHGNAGSGVAPLAFVHRHRGRDVGKLPALAGIAEIAAIERRKIGAVGGIVALRYHRRRQEKPQANRARQRAKVQGPVLGAGRFVSKSRVRGWNSPKGVVEFFPSTQRRGGGPGGRSWAGQKPAPSQDGAGFLLFVRPARPSARAATGRGRRAAASPASAPARADPRPAASAGWSRPRSRAATAAGPAAARPAVSAAPAAGRCTRTPVTARRPAPRSRTSVPDAGRARPPALVRARSSNSRSRPAPRRPAG